MENLPPASTYPPPPIPPKPRRPFRRFLLTLGAVLGTLIALLLIVAVFFDGPVTQMLIRELNKSLKTKLEVRDASLSLLSGFPNASVNLKQVRLKDPFGGDLLLAKEMAFRFNLLSLFGDDIKVRSVRISDAALRLRIDRQGHSNADIFKENSGGQQQPGGGETKLQLALDNAELRNVGLLYDNAKTSQSAEVMVNNLILSGNFSAQKFELASRADLKVKQIDSDSSRYLSGERVQYDAVLKVDLTKGLYDIQRLQLTLGGNTFDVDGVAINKGEYSELNLKMVSQEGDISMVANLLPEEYGRYFRDFQSSGNYSCSGSIRGRIGKAYKPQIAFDVAMREGRVTSEKLQAPLQHVGFHARYIAQPDGSGDFEITDFKGDFGGQPLDMVLKVSNLNDPVVDFRANGVLPMAAAYGLFDDPEVSDGDGFVRFRQVSVQGRYADMTSMRRIANVQAAGEVQFDRAEITYKKIPVSARHGVLRLQDNLFTVDSLFLMAGKSDFALDGTARNLLPVLFSDSLNTADAFLEFSAKLNSNRIQLDELFELFGASQAAEQQANSQRKLDSLHIDNAEARKRYTERLKGTFEASIASFAHKKVLANFFKGRLAFDHNEMLINGDVQAMEGQVHLEGNTYFENRPRMKLRITAQNLNLNTVMVQMENFGQETILAENLRGTLTGRIAVDANWDEKGEFDMNRLRMLADVNATNGQLVRLKMLDDFSTYIHLADLRDVRFTNMQNYLEISGQTLYIPTMFIQSNAVNLTLSGTHTFNNDINYFLKVNAGQTLLNRIKSHDPDLDPLPAEKGWFNLYYTIRGNLDKYDMKRGKRTVKSEFERSEARKQQIAAAIDAEFRQVTAFPQERPGAQKAEEEEFLPEIVGGAGKQ